jgi:photosystem II stability/assembly factor-like uncharacterized protein
MAFTRSAVFKIFLALALLAGPALADEGWVPIGPPGGEVTHLLIHPRNPQILWAGTPFYGIYKSVDGGASWSPVNQGLVRRDVQALAVAPGNPQVLYAVTGGRVYRSGNGGRTWTVVLPCGGDPPPCCGCIAFARVLEMVVDPQDPQTVFAVTHRGVVKSVDGGVRWRNVRVGDSSIYTLVFEPGNPKVLYALGDGRLFRSRNGGASWTLVNQERIEAGPEQQLVIDPRNPRRMWMAGSSSRGVYRSTDGGAHWQLFGSGFFGALVRDLTLSPAAGAGFPTVWVGSSDGLFRSLDGGVTWKIVLRRWVETIATHPVQPATLWVGTRSTGRSATGVYKSVNRGASWAFSSRGIFHATAGALAVDPVTPGVYWAANDAGVWRSADGGFTWTERNGDLPRHLFVQALAIDPSDPETVWAGTSAGVFVTEDGGVRWEARREGLSVPDPLPFAPVRLLRLAPSDPSIVYAGGVERLFKTVDAGRHWTLLPSPPLLSLGALEDVWVDPRNSDVLFVVWGGVWVSRDGGASWSAVPVGSGAASFRSVEGDPRDPDVLYAAGDEGVFRSTDGGQAWQLVADLAVTWQGNLTVGPAGEVWAGAWDDTGFGGIYFSPDGLSGWTLLPGIELIHTLFVLEADPHDPGTVFAGASVLMSGNVASGLFRHTGD